MNFESIFELFNVFYNGWVTLSWISISYLKCDWLISGKIILVVYKFSTLYTGRVLLCNYPHKNKFCSWFFFDSPVKWPDNFLAKIKIKATEACCLSIPLAEVAGTSDPSVCQFLSFWFMIALWWYEALGMVKALPFNFKLPMKICQRLDLNSLSYPSNHFALEN